jgi:hypothetical protein
VLRHLLAHDDRDAGELVLAVRPSGVRSVNPAHLPLEAGDANLEEFVEVAAVDARNLRRSRSGVRGSSASCSTRRLNSSQLSSRLT